MLKLHVQPRASKNEITGIHDNTLKVRLTSPPIEGAANAACITFLSKVLDIKKNRIELIAGQKSRDKLIKITGCSIEDIKKSVMACLDK